MLAQGPAEQNRVGRIHFCPRVAVSLTFLKQQEEEQPQKGPHGSSPEPQTVKKINCQEATRFNG